MSWFFIVDSDGNRLRRVFAMNEDDLAANVPEGCTAEPTTSESLVIAAPEQE